MNNLDTKLMAAVTLVWAIFALAYGWLGMLSSAATWGAGACIFLIFTVALTLAQRRHAGSSRTAAAQSKRAHNLDTSLIAAVAVVWSIFAIVYGALGMTISAATWGVGAWLFLGLTAGLLVAGRRAGLR